MAESRPFLAAAETFERLGARPWLRRAVQELRATGRAPHRTEDLLAASLTAHERTIVELAATGLTNKEIGERLFLSHRTVATHLYRVFPKLGSPPGPSCAKPSPCYRPSNGQDLPTGRVPAPIGDPPRPAR